MNSSISVLLAEFPCFNLSSFFFVKILKFRSSNIFINKYIYCIYNIYIYYVYNIIYIFFPISTIFVLPSVSIAFTFCSQFIIHSFFNKIVIYCINQLTKIREAVFSLSLSNLSPSSFKLAISDFSADSDVSTPLTHFESAFLAQLENLFPVLYFHLNVIQQENIHSFYIIYLRNLFFINTTIE